MNKMHRLPVMEREHEQAIRELCVRADAACWNLRDANLMWPAKQLEDAWKKVMQEVLP